MRWPLCSRISNTIRTARSRSWSGYFFGAGTGPLSRGFSASINPGRFTAALDATLRDVPCGLPLEPDRLTIAGFSDGASYALTLSVTNGDPLRCVVAFSPGFSAAREDHGRPAFLVTLGLHARSCRLTASRRVVPILKRSCYDVDYREFDGGHVVPPDLTLDAADWLAR